MNKNLLYRISASRFLASYSEYIINFLLPILTFKTFGGIAESGWVVFFHVSFRLMGYPVSGTLCDYFSEKNVLILTSFIRALLCALACILFMSATQNQSLLLVLFTYLLASVDGLAGGVTQIAFESMGPRLYPGPQFRTFQAAVQSSDQVALCLAPLSGALLLSLLGTSGLFASLGISFFGAAVLFLAHPHSAKTHPTQSPHSSTPFRPSLKHSIKTLTRPFALILGNRIIFATLILTLLDNFLMGFYGALITPMGMGLFQVSERRLGLALTLGYLASLLAISWSHWVQPRKSTLWLWKFSYLIAYAGFFLMGFAPDFWVFVLSVILIEASCAAGVFALRLIRADIIPHSDFGKISGLLFLFQQISLPCGGIMVAFFSEPKTLQNLMTLSSFIVGLLTLGVFGLILKLDKPILSE